MHPNAQSSQLRVDLLSSVGKVISLEGLIRRFGIQTSHVPPELRWSLRVASYVQLN